VRYRIAPSTDPLDTAPSLWRSGTGRFGTDGLVKTEPGAGGFNPVGSPWQLVARGIEDLQVEYRDGGGLWTNSPPVVAPANLATVVREVRVTLSARTTSGNLQGGTDPGTGSTAPRAFRGQLTRIVAPRGSLVALQVRGAYR
jgi:hypothetical protein